MGGFGANDDDGSGRSQPSKGMKHEKAVNVKRAYLRSRSGGEFILFLHLLTTDASGSILNW